MPQSSPRIQNGVLERCAHMCHQCEGACLQSVAHCLDKGGDLASPARISVLLDCVAICAASHDLLYRGSPHHTHTCGACAAICEACAESCERAGAGDARLAKCAEVCHQCAESCREMARGM